MKNRPGRFFLKWRNVTHGYEFVTTYRYDGGLGQEGYSRTGWINRCIAAGKAEGNEYLGMTTEG